MKEFLFTLLAMKPCDVEITDPKFAVSRSNSFHADKITLPRRATAIRMVDDARLYFDMFDVKQTGYIDIEELQLVMDFMIPKDDEHNTDTINAQVEDMFHFMDKGKNGRIDFDEFKEFYRAVMVASTQMKVNINTKRHLSFVQAINTIQSRSYSDEIE